MKDLINNIKEGIALRIISIAFSILPSGNLKKKIALFITDELIVPEKDFVHEYSLYDYRTINSLINKEANKINKGRSSNYFQYLNSLSEKTLFNIKNAIYKNHK